MSAKLTRRNTLGRLAAPAIIGPTQTAGRLLCISHQFPSGTGDSRHRMCQRFADLVQERTGGSLEFQVYPAASLAKTSAQISRLRKGALNSILVPLTYAGGEIHEMNISFMPAL